MADYGNYTTYHFDDVDEMSDYESTGAPPPPPPDDDYAKNGTSGGGGGTSSSGKPMVDELPRDLETADGGHHAASSEYDKLNTTMGTSPDVYDDDDVGEDGSVEIPPTKVVEDMMRREQEAQVDKGGNKVVFMSAILCILLSLAIILGAGFGTGAFGKKGTTTNIEANAVTVDGYTPNTIPGEEEEDEPTTSSGGGSSGVGNSGSGGAAQDPIEETESENFEERPVEVTVPPPTVGGGGGGGTTDNTSRGQNMREYLSTVALGGAGSFSDLSSPESLALQWLVLEDPLQLDATNEDHHFQITQRYALVTLWYNSDFTWANETNWLNGDECSWHGISCMSLTAMVEVPELGGDGNATVSKNEDEKEESISVVTAINLEGNNVQGQIPADLALLTAVTSLNLADNVIEGALPRTLTQFSSLEELYLDRNLLTQDLSSYDFSPLASTLTLLDLSSNKFSGNLPSSLFKLAKLELLVIDNNAFIGALSEDISQLTALTRLTAGGNQFSGGLPAALSQMSNLQVVWLFKNQFTGPLPEVWADSLLVLDVYDNDMSGNIPVNITLLPNLQQLVLGGNRFDGPIPDEIGQNMRQLTVLNLEDCEFTGPAMPQSLGNLGNLTVMRLGNNANMEPDFLPQYVFNRWPALEELRLPGLKLRGDLDSFNWRNLRRLRIVDLSNNFLRNFPQSITFCDDLEELNLSDNPGMGGNLPDGMDSLMNLRQLQVANAGLRGNLTGSLGNMQMLEYLDLTNNTLLGTLPNLGGMTNAQELKFGTNFFTGEIPESVGQLTRLAILDLSVNFLRGELPESISEIESLTVLKLGDNSNEQPYSGFSSELPSSFSKLANLVRLELFSNRFTGALPPEWGSLNKLQLLDVEFNPLTGNVPVEYGGMTSLKELYVSNTDIEGSVPEEVCAVSPQFFVVDCTVECSCCSRCEAGDQVEAEKVEEDEAGDGGRRRRRTV